MIKYYVRTESRKSKDFYPTPAWATRALFEKVMKFNHTSMFWNPSMTCLEPACGKGHMVMPLREYFSLVYASDIEDYGFGNVRDFLGPQPLNSYDWVITNPPFANEMPAKFVLHARNIATKGIAIFARCHLIEGKWRYDNLFSKFQPNIIAPFVERVTIMKNHVTRQNKSVTPYAWFIWDVNHENNKVTQIRWIPPCKKELERTEDYYAATEQRIDERV